VTSELRRLIEIAALVSVLSAARLASAQEPSLRGSAHVNVILGVLEDFPGEYAGDPDFRAVRAIFSKVGEDWQAFPTDTNSYRDLQTLPASYPKEVTWTIAFDGRNLGSVTSRTPSRFKLYSEIGMEEIVSPSTVPTIGAKSADYSGYLRVPLYRPLVAVSQPNVSDPDQWKRADLAHDRVAAARRQFRLEFPKATNCRNPEENIAKPWMYQDEDIHVGKAYSSKSGWSLIEMNLTGNECDGEQGFQEAFNAQWFVIEPAGAAKFLGNDMWLVDAGDYDNDGRAELLFAIDAHNRGGYRLYYQNFAKNAEFAFRYH
jgi:hypothetical protein